MNLVKLQTIGSKYQFRGNLLLVICVICFGLAAAAAMYGEFEIFVFGVMLAGITGTSSILTSVVGAVLQDFADCLEEKSEQG